MSLFATNRQEAADRYAPFEQKAGESLADYLKRLKATREGGILGTGGLAPMTPYSAPSEEPSVAESAVAQATGGGSTITAQSATDPRDIIEGVSWRSGDDPFGTGKAYGGYTSELEGGQGYDVNDFETGMGLLENADVIGAIGSAFGIPALSIAAKLGGGYLADKAVDAQGRIDEALKAGTSAGLSTGTNYFDEPLLQVSDVNGNLRNLTQSQVDADLDLIANSGASGLRTDGLFKSDAFGNAREAAAVLRDGLASDSQFGEINRQFTSLPVSSSSGGSTVIQAMSTPTSTYTPATSTAAPQYMDFNFGATTPSTGGMLVSAAEEDALSRALATGADATAGTLSINQQIADAMIDQAFEEAIAEDEANKASTPAPTPAPAPAPTTSSSSSYTAPTRVTVDEFEAAIAQDAANKASTSSSGGSGSSSSSGGLSTSNGGLTKNSNGTYTVNKTTSSSSSGSSSGGSSGTYCCTKMRDRGIWDSPIKVYRMHKWHYDQPQWWRDGYDVWGKVIADKLIAKGKFFPDLLDAFYDRKVKKGKITAKSLMANVIMYPAVFAIGMTRKLTNNHVEIVQTAE